VKASTFCFIWRLYLLGYRHYPLASVAEISYYPPSSL